MERSQVWSTLSLKFLGAVAEFHRPAKPRESSDANDETAGKSNECSSRPGERGAFVDPVEYLESLDQRKAQAEQRLLEIDADMIDVVQKQIRQFREERQRLIGDSQLSEPDLPIEDSQQLTVESLPGQAAESENRNH